MTNEDPMNALLLDSLPIYEDRSGLRCISPQKVLDMVCSLVDALELEDLGERRSAACKALRCLP